MYVGYLDVECDQEALAPPFFWQIFLSSIEYGSQQSLSVQLLKGLDGDILCSRLCYSSILCIYRYCILLGRSSSNQMDLSLVGTRSFLVVRNLYLKMEKRKVVTYINCSFFRFTMNFGIKATEFNYSTTFCGSIINSSLYFTPFVLQAGESSTFAEDAAPKSCFGKKPILNHMMLNGILSPLLSIIFI